ncbi:fimbrillin family protein [Parabacteroides sp. OttesenSCG-928-G07]|nr:fimbrillin family protein [Parabacteroides sp. OttesenSCG-928-G07]
MKLRYICYTLATLLFLAACNEEKYSPDVLTSTGVVELFATIGKADQVETRADKTSYGTYIDFTTGDKIGLYATRSLRKYDYLNPEKSGSELPAVENLRFQLDDTSTNARWGDDSGEPLLKWDTKVLGKESADIYAYFPYQESYNNAENGNFNIFANSNGNEGQLTDILVAQRTTVENNNPAIFLTFKHRFSLLYLSLGTGMAAVTDEDEILALTTEGIAKEATIQLKDYVVRLEEGDINHFKAVRSGKKYYIILPAGAIGSGTDSLRVEQIKIGKDVPSDLGVPIMMQPGTIYHMTMHKHEGSITFEANGIEIWGGNHDLGGIREEPGIYWASDLSSLIAQYNKNPNKTNISLEAYGVWDEENERWEFDLRRHIDMNDINWTDVPFNSFYGIFNGNGYSITGLDMANGNGLFNEVVAESEISDLTLLNISINSDGSAGALAGTVTDAIIHNCHVTGNSIVNGGGSTGGLIGSASGVTITRSSSTAEVNASGSNVGGLIGDLSGGSLDGSYATGRVTAEGSAVGGLVGSSDSPTTNSYAASNVTGVDNVGGLVGMTSADIENCYAVGDINGKQNVGGLTGKTSGNVSHSSSGGTVTGEGIAGGLIGLLSSDTGVSYSYSRSAVNASTRGGLIGQANKVITKETIIDPEPVDPGESEDENTNPDPIIIIEYESGPKITYSYATNNLPLLGSGGWMEYCYDTGKVDITAEMGVSYSSIDLSTIGEEEGTDINALLTDLNSEEGDITAWVISFVIVDGQKYALPILTSNK